MATRTIITSQPDVTCDVCERRLLRGEQPEVFLAGGQPRMVCELCVPRAAHQGWARESERERPTPVPARSRRSRGLLERLRHGTRPADEAPLGDQAPAEPGDGGPYDFLTGGRPHAARRSAAAASEQLDAGQEASWEAPAASRRALAGSVVVPEDETLQRAVEIFNGGSYPRRIAGLARSLGAPTVSVLPVEGVVGVVSIVVAWELCWYRYRVDVDDPQAGADMVAEGRELDEIERDERVGNAAADALGVVALAG